MKELYEPTIKRTRNSGLLPEAHLFLRKDMFKVGIYTWMGNEYFMSQQRFRRDPETVTKILEKYVARFVTVLKQTYHMVIIIIGGSAELWNAPKGFDDQMEIMRDLFRA